MDVSENVNNGDEDTFDAAAAFESLWGTDAQKPSAEDEKKKPAETEQAEDEQTDDTDHSEGDDDKSDRKVQDEDGDDDGDDGEQGDQGEEKKFVESDDIFVKVKVGDKEEIASVKDLKRLFGQEAALTRKSQEVAATRTAVNEQAQFYTNALTTQLERARKAWLPYQNADWAAAARTLDEETFEAARATAQAAYENVQFFEQELGAVTKKLQEQAKTEYEKSAKACLAALTDPDGGIPGFDQQIEKDIRTFACEQGLSKDVVAGLTDPAAFKIIHMAMQYQRGKAKVAAAVDDKAKAKKKAPPKKIVKGSSNSNAARSDTSGKSKADKAMEKLKQTGSRDDAANAFAAMWASDNDE